MRPAKTQVHLLPPSTRAFRSGVSLHSHTEHSQEGLGKLPGYLERMPIVSQFTKWQIDRHYATTGETIDFSKAYWRGPLTAQSAYELEKRQIEKLGLQAIVSLTDHDNIDAGLQLQSAASTGDVPVSVEWTVPYEKSSFHLGIHNIAAKQARSWMKRMAHYTRVPQQAELNAIFEELDSCANVLIVLNHPLWDIGAVGSTEIASFVRRFLGAYGRYVHALEINGMRSWTENLATLSLAGRFDCPVVSGGDRHGLEPNATINLTRAESFADFVREIREERVSEIAMMRNTASRWCCATCLPLGTLCANIPTWLTASIGRLAWWCSAMTGSSVRSRSYGPKERRRGSIRA